MKRSDFLKTLIAAPAAIKAVIIALSGKKPNIGPSFMEFFTEAEVGPYQPFKSFSLSDSEWEMYKKMESEGFLGFDELEQKFHRNCTEEVEKYYMRTHKYYVNEKK